MRNKSLKILLLSSAIIPSGCNKNNTEKDSVSDFVDDESENNSSVSSFSQGEMIGLKIKK